tara:strand:- start:866 stop:1516 length:651 start_codon:yes stop_codon:yes gene_type:complete
MINLKNINKSYFEKDYSQVIFENLNFRFEKSGAYSVVGSSGSGKTTFLNLISGLDSFESGSLEVDGIFLEDLNNNEKSEVRKNLFGFAYQFHYLLENLTVYENCLAANHGKIPYGLERILSKLGINSLKDKFPTNISGGERQRASIARAICTNPKILIMDEPTGNLDQENSLIVQDFILDYANENKTLVVFATHDNDFALKADKTLNIENRNIKVG